YVRDDETGEVWSPTPEPAGAPARYLVRHTAGETRFEHEAHGLTQQLSVFVSPGDPVKLSLLRIHNQGSRRRQLSLFAVVEWVLGGSREYSRVGICSRWDATLQASLAHHPLSAFPNAHAFFTSSHPIHSWSQDREEFFGVDGSRALPRALGRSELSRNEQPGLDPCAALQVRLSLEPGEHAELAFALGRADSLDEALRLAAQYRRPGAAEASLQQARRSWDDILDTVQIETPDPALDALANRWLLYQTLCGRLWARTGFYQSSGAFGFRDQLQDSLALLHARPDLVREHVLRCARRQFEEGDVQHWWHDETGEGIRTRCSDDMLWLPYAVAEYVRATGDRALLDEQVPFLSARPLARGEEDSFGSPAVSASHASVYEHCTRALDVGTTRGQNGLPTLRGGDWNDGMNRVGHEGRGESIWLAWFLARTLLDFAEIARERGDTERAEHCQREVTRLGAAVERHGWDGEWYLRAFFDDGSPLGSARRSECQIDAIAQSWAVIAGIGDP
ncbi:MAG TPA: protein ndvB, partial [Polyangiaceae bacterium]|nr:protein ndvB [Polyangiaceae bacterium]